MKDKERSDAFKSQDQEGERVKRRAGIYDWQRSELYRNAFALPNSPRRLFNTVSNFDHIIVKIRRKYRNKEATKMVGRKKKMVLTNKVSNNSVALF